MCKIATLPEKTMRIKTRWNQHANPQSIETIASAVGAICWQIASNGVLELENKGYKTKGDAHRLQLIGEFLAFSLQVVDRLAFEQLKTEERQRFITALALHIANIFADNQRDVQGEGEYKQSFIDLLNQRADDYAELKFHAGKAGFDFLRYFGEQITALMEKDHFVGQQIMEIEGPNAIQTLTEGMQLLEGRLDTLQK